MTFAQRKIDALLKIETSDEDLLMQFLAWFSGQPTL